MTGDIGDSMIVRFEGKSRVKGNTEKFNRCRSRANLTVIGNVLFELLARQEEYITEQNTDANVSTNIVQHVNTTTNTTENRYEDITEDDTTELRPTLTEDLLLNALNTNRGILRKTDVTEDTADITDFIKVPGKRKKKKTDTDDETETKRKAIHTYKIGIDIIQQIVQQHNAIDKLPE